MAIYALLDFDNLQKYGITIKDFCKTAKGLKAKILQYRDKNSPLDKKIQRIIEIRKYWKKPLIINDNIELLPYCDGIHIGQEDLQELCEKFEMNEYDVIDMLKHSEKLKNKLNTKLYTLHSSFTKKIVGLSTHNKEEILKANKLPLSYIGLGAYRPTSTKNTTNILGDKVISLINYSYHPVAVIGGVKIYDKIPAKFKVVGSDICRLTYIQSKKKRIFKRK